MKYQIEEISKQIKIEKTIKKIIKTIMLAILITLLISNIIMFYQTNIKHTEIPQVAGISVFNIVSGSMKPTININDLIVIKKCKESEIENEDIITYKKADGTVVTHRVIRKNKENGEIVYVTKGDNNPVEDNGVVKYSQVHGKYLFKIKGIGGFVEKLQKNNGLISVAIAIIIFVILKNGRDKKKETRKIAREKYDIKKKREEYNIKNKKNM